VNILYFHAATVLEDEIVATLQGLGHQVRVLNVGGHVRVLSAGHLLEQLDASRPHFVLTVNYQGFDRDGEVRRLLAGRGVPVASWELDHPLAMELLGLRPKPPGGELVQFVWDEGYVQELREWGYERVEYLPLGVDLRGFDQPSPSRLPRHGAVFVGTSLREFHEHLVRRLLGVDYRQHPVLAGILEEAYQAHLRDTAIPLIDHLRELAAAGPRVFADDLGARRFELFAEIHLSLRYRQDVVASIRDLEVFGDPGWREVVPAGRYRGRVNYGSELAELYRDSAVVLNATLPKNRWDINQRVFDVFAASSLVLTDRRRNLDRFFGPSEIPVYARVEEAAGMLRDLRADPERRLALIEAGRARVLAEHGLDRRLAVLTRHMAEYLGISAGES